MPMFQVHVRGSDEDSIYVCDSADRAVELDLPTLLGWPDEEVIISVRELILPEQEGEVRYGQWAARKVKLSES
jgi:hypothetical protein